MCVFVRVIFVAQNERKMYDFSLIIESEKAERVEHAKHAKEFA